MGGKLHEASKAFIQWATVYDTGDMKVRSRALHEYWLERLKCPVLRLEGDLTVEERGNAVIDKIAQLLYY